MVGVDEHRFNKSKLLTFEDFSVLPLKSNEALSLSRHFAFGFIDRVFHALVRLSTQERNHASPIEPGYTVDCSNKKFDTVNSIHNSDAPGEVRFRLHRT
jgi:hypothetical protein